MRSIASCWTATGGIRESAVRDTSEIELLQRHALQDSVVQISVILFPFPRAQATHRQCARWSRYWNARLNIPVGVPLA